jgi:N-acetylmuramoyl-L-alanine amidase
MRYNWILDNGHGGVNPDTCEYVTCPDWKEGKPKTWHKMHVHPFGPLYEGEFNRQIVGRIAEKLDELGIKYSVLVPSYEDVSLKDRVETANEMFDNDKSCIFVSIHGNAFNTNAKGFEVFTSKGLTRSDAIAEVFAEKMSAMFPDKVMRWDLTDGDKDKEANFYLLRKTDMPAILTENFFFDRYEEALLMTSEEGQDKIAQAHVDAILKIETDGKRY